METPFPTEHRTLDSSYQDPGRGSLEEHCPNRCELPATSFPSFPVHTSTSATHLLRQVPEGATSGVRMPPLPCRFSSHTPTPPSGSRAALHLPQCPT